jgi:hypothetical protein
MSLSVDLNAYNSGSQWSNDADVAANMSAEQLGELSKAMQAGHILGSSQGNPSQTNMGALKVESLERSLKLIEFKESDIRFWKRIPKTAAYSTIEEYNQQTSYGNEAGGFVGEGELPEEEDSQYVRKSEKVKFIGVTRSVTDVAQMVKTNVGSIIQKETDSGIMWVLRKANRALFHGDEYMVSHEFNGAYAQHLNNDRYVTLSAYHNSEHVIDLRGKALTQFSLENACRVILTNYGHANLLVAPPSVLSDFATRFYANQRTNIGQSGAVNNAEVGQYISQFRSQFGVIDFEYDLFATSGVGKLASAGTVPAKAPATPTAGAAPAPVADGEHNFTGSAGDYFYAVSAVNRYGESAMVQLGAGLITVAANQAVDLTFTATAGPYAASSYKIYRSKTTPTTSYATTLMYPIMTVAATGTGKQGSVASGVDGGAAGKVRDRNRFLPGTEKAFLLQADTEVYEFKQLAPLMKRELSKLGPSSRFMVSLYGTPIFYNPNKMVVFWNIGSDIS